MENFFYDTEIDKIIKKDIMSILYFSGSTCGACDVIRVKVESILKNYEEITMIEINGVLNKKLSAKYDVFSLPVLLLFIDGKESLRFGRNIDLLEFERNIDRYYNMIYV